MKKVVEKDNEHDSKFTGMLAGGAGLYRRHDVVEEKKEEVRQDLKKVQEPLNEDYGRVKKSRVNDAINDDDKHPVENEKE